MKIELITKKILLIMVLLTPFIAPVQIVDEPLQAAPENTKLIFSILGVSLLLLIFTIGSYINKQFNIYKSSLYIPIIGFVLWNLISLFWIDNYFLAIVSIFQYFVVGLFFVFVVNFIELKDIEKLLFIIVISVLGISIIGLSQYYFSNYQFVHDFFWQSGKPASTFANKNMASHFLVITLPVVVGLFLFVKDKFTTYFSALVLFVGSWFLMYASARQAYLASIIQFVFFTLFFVADYIKNKETSVLSNIKNKSLKKYLIIVVTISLVVVSFVSDKGLQITNNGYVNTQKLDRVVDIVDTDNERIPGWINTIEMIKDNFLIGIGAGQWRDAYPMYIDSKSNDLFLTDYTTAKRLHNDYLEVFANVGAIGFIFLLWIFFVTSYRLVRIITNPVSLNRVLVLGMSVGLLGFAIVAMVSFPVQVYVPIFFVLLYIALIDIIYTRNKKIFKSSSLFNIVISVFVIFMFFIFYQALNWIYAESSYILSNKFEQKHNYGKAIELSKKAANFNKYNGLYWLSIGRNFNKKGDYDKSIEYLERGLKYSPNSKIGMLSLTKSYNKVGNTNKEKELLKVFLSKYPNDVNALARMSAYYLNQGSTDKALNLYKELKVNFDKYKDRKGFFPFHKEVAELANKFRDYKYISYVYTDMINKSWYIKKATDFAVLATIEYFRLDNKNKGIKLYKKALQIDKDVKLPDIIIQKLIANDLYN